MNALKCLRTQLKLSYQHLKSTYIVKSLTFSEQYINFCTDFNLIYYTHCKVTSIRVQKKVISDFFN